MKKKKKKCNDEDFEFQDIPIEPSPSILDEFLSRKEIPTASILSSQECDDEEIEKRILNNPSINYAESISVSLPSGHVVSVSSSSLSFEKLSVYFSSIFEHVTHQKIKGNYFIINDKGERSYLG